MHLNIHGLVSKLTDLKFLNMELRKIGRGADVILLCETFLHEQNLAVCNIPGYSLVNNHRKNRKGGGVSIFIKSEIKYHRRTDLEINIEREFESIFIEVEPKHITSRNTIINEIYRVPGHQSKTSMTIMPK